MTIRSIEVLVIAGCPHADSACERAREAARDAEVDAEVRLVLVESDDDAQRLRFLGSPSVRVDGIDVDATGAERSEVGLQCRVYDVDGRLSGAPPIRWIADALRRSAGESDSVEVARSSLAREGRS